MLKEYALDPDCLKTWQSFRYLIENFGVPHGRLIAEYPRHWLRLVYESCAGFSFQHKQKMIDELKRIKRSGLCRTSRVYDGKLEWLQNAIAQQEISPFHAIIALEANPDFKVLNADELSRTVPLWAIKRDDKFARTREGLGSAAAKFLQMSERILFVDKMFDPEIDRWRDMLLHLMQVAVIGRGDIPSFEYHTKIDNEEFAKPAIERRLEFETLCVRELAGGMPPGSKLKVCRWDQKHRGDFFHSRYILSEKGGLRIDWGLDGGRPGERTDVSLMDEALWQEYLYWFREPSEVLELVDSVEIDSNA